MQYFLLFQSQQRMSMIVVFKQQTFPLVLLETLITFINNIA